MRSETKLVKKASRSALAGGGERDRLLDDCKAPEVGWLVSHNRLGQVSLSIARQGGTFRSAEAPFPTVDNGFVRSRRNFTRPVLQAAT